MRNIIKFAKENNFEITEQSVNEYGERKVRIKSPKGNWYSVRDHESDSTLTIYGWSGHSEPYAVASNQFDRSNYFKTQKDIVSNIKFLESL